MPLFPHSPRHEDFHIQPGRGVPPAIPYPLPHPRGGRGRDGTLTGRFGAGVFRGEEAENERVRKGCDIQADRWDRDGAEGNPGFGELEGELIRSHALCLEISARKPTDPEYKGLLEELLGREIDGSVAIVR